MARIRSIKPEFWSSEDVSNVSRDARLLFIGMWNFADDVGNGQASPKSLRMKVFPGDDDIDDQTIMGLLQELSKNDLVDIYKAEGKQYYHVTNWYHQRIDKPQKPKFPEYSTNTPRTLSPDRIGKDKIGKDRKGYTDDFEQLWAVHRKGGKLEAFKAFNKFRPKGEELQRWIDSLEAWKQSQGWNKDGGQYALNLSSWINQGYFDSEPTKPQDSLDAQMERLSG
jgi:hypothetical protein